jgi:DNA-binding NarL/FixJ family response regulator
VSTSDAAAVLHGKTLRVLVVEDNPLLASAIAEILEREEDLSVCGIARTGVEAGPAALSGGAAVALMDFSLPDMSGPAAAALIRTHLPEIRIVFHSAEESETDLLDAIDVGAVAYLTKSATADQIVEALRRASSGEILIPVALLARALARQRTVSAKQQELDRVAAQFTARELEILKLLAQGLSTLDLSTRLEITANTIEWHVGNVIDKLGVHSKLQAVIAAARMGLIDIETL